MTARAVGNENFSDVEFLVHEVLFRAHKCVLVARCDFLDMFTSKWKSRQVIRINHPEVSKDYYQKIGAILFAFI